MAGGVQSGVAGTLIPTVNRLLLDTTMLIEQESSGAEEIFNKDSLEYLILRLDV